MWHAPYSACAHISGSALLTSVDGTDLRGYSKFPPIEEAIAAHLCPSASLRVKSAAVHPNKPCRTPCKYRWKSVSGSISPPLYGCSSSFPSEQGPDPEIFRELRSATDLALRATKMTAQSIGRAMGSLVVLDRHLWLTLTDMKDAEKAVLLNAPSVLQGFLVARWNPPWSNSPRHKRNPGRWSISCRNALVSHLPCISGSGV